MSALYEEDGPATLILVAGDADYVPPLEKAIEKGWRVEVAFVDKGVSAALDRVVHEYRTVDPRTIQHYPDYPL